MIKGEDENEDEEDKDVASEARGENEDEEDNEDAIFGPIFCVTKKGLRGGRHSGFWQLATLAGTDQPSCATQDW